MDFFNLITGPELLEKLKALLPLLIPRQSLSTRLTRYPCFVPKCGTRRLQALELPAMQVLV
jgi:hypothetical protein